MGAVSDGSFLKYTMNSDGTRVDVAKQNRLNGVSNHSLGGIIAVGASQYLPQILSGLASKISNNDDNEESNGLSAKELRSNIDEILNKYQASTTADIQAKLNVAETYEKKLGEYNDKNAELKEATANVESLTKQLNKLKNSSNQPTDYKKVEADLQKAIEEQQKLEKEVKDLEAETTALSEEITATESADTIRKDLANLYKYEKQLKRAEGRDAIEKLKNPETEEIVKLVGKLKKAKADKNEPKTQQYETKLKEVGQEYYQKHEIGDNKTLDTLLTAYNITK